MRLKTESEIGHALPVSLLILRKKPNVLQSTKIDQGKRKPEQICIWNPMTTGFIPVCKH